MSDPLKKYIQDNRDEFDNLEPSRDILFKIKGELKSQPKEKKGILSLIVSHKWMAAASVLIIMTLTYIFITNTKLPEQQLVKTDVPQNPKEQVLVQDKENIEVKEANRALHTKVRKWQKRDNKQPQINLLAAYRDLTDSTSASTRLAAILNIQKSTVISYDIIDKLSHTLNHDSNSNVRLAALNLMSKYAQDSYVNNVFMLSLSNQKDPLLQLGLMELLQQTNNPKLDDKLYALANDPMTLAEVKDQAYLILINQNKL